MTISGYDADIAAANGFTIVTHDDGSQESVPVTPEAKATVARYGAANIARVEGDGGEVVVTPFGTVSGNCGSSMIEATDNGNYVFVETGYDVIAPVSNRIGWVANLYAWSGAYSISWGSGPSPGHWRGYGGAFIDTPGYTVASGDVILITGAVCGSGGPQDGW